MQKFGLIGYPLKHSFSPQIHKIIYELNNIDASYSLSELAPNMLNQNFLKNIHKDYFGFNVTIPYKTDIIPYLDDLDDQVKKIGAVNTIKKVNNKWIGYNTDVDGFCYPIMENCDKINTCLLVGTGGAAKAVMYALVNFVKPENLIILGRNIVKAQDLKNNFNNISGSIQIEANRISKIKNYLNNTDMIVNATSVGMYPNTNVSIFPDIFSLKNNAIVYDIIYNPLETKLLRQVKENCQNCVTINGIQMLVAQAVKSVEIWTGKKISIENTINALDKSEIIK